MVAHIDKPAFTRADLVELVGALLPVDVPADPRALIEESGHRVSADLGIGSSAGVIHLRTSAASPEAATKQGEKS
jgi:hypothetical protein